TRGPGGHEARLILGSLTAGAIATTSAINLAVNKRAPVFDPDDPQFLKFNLPGSGRSFDLFGPFYPIIKDTARVSKALAEGDVGKASDVFKSSILNKASIPVRIAERIGRVLFQEDPRDFQGDPISKDFLGFVQESAREFGVPIGIDETIDGILGGQPEAALSLIGLDSVGSPFNETDVLFRRQKDINPDGKGWLDADTGEKNAFDERYPELAAQRDAKARGVFGTANRAYDAAVDLAHERITNSWEENRHKMLRGEQGAGATFRDDVATQLSQLAGKREELFKELKTDDREPADYLEEALFAYWDTFLPIEEGGSKMGSGRINWTIADKIQTDLEATWRELSLEKGKDATYVQSYVEENSGQRDVPESMRPFFELTRQLRQLDWANMHRQLRQWDGWSPAMKQFVEDGFQAERENNTDTWLEGFDDPAAARKKFNDVKRLVAKKKAEIQQKDDNLDKALALYYGSPPSSIETQVYYVSKNLDSAAQLRFILSRSGEGRTRMNEPDWLALLSGGIRTVQDLARATPERLARITGRRVDTIKDWNWRGQAQAILRKLGRVTAGREAA
ncbi:MAG: helix-hairpin-helix domain-containing protein, partial [Chloroflexi bacterium]|nr:helix-hairpin-helix domain-containing protein [Chloroflexota bacterium]